MGQIFRKLSRTIPLLFKRSITHGSFAKGTLTGIILQKNFPTKARDSKTSCSLTQFYERARKGRQGCGLRRDSPEARWGGIEGNGIVGRFVFLLHFFLHLKYFKRRREFDTQYSMHEYVRECTYMDLSMNLKYRYRSRELVVSLLVEL